MREKIVTLEHHTHLLAQLLQFASFLWQRLTIDENRSFVDAFEAVDGAAGGGFSRAGRPEHDDYLTLAHFQ